MMQSLTAACTEWREGDVLLQHGWTRAEHNLGERSDVRYTLAARLNKACDARVRESPLR